MFSLISLRDIFSINRLALIPNIISQSDIKHTMTIKMKAITSVLKSITARPIGLFEKKYCSNRTCFIRIIISL